MHSLQKCNILDVACVWRLVCHPWLLLRAPELQNKCEHGSKRARDQEAGKRVGGSASGANLITSCNSASGSLHSLYSIYGEQSVLTGVWGNRDDLSGIRPVKDHPRRLIALRPIPAWMWEGGGGGTKKGVRRMNVEMIQCQHQQHQHQTAALTSPSLQYLL
jgi:hypothetical protein